MTYALGRELGRVTAPGGSVHLELEMTLDEFRQSLTATEPPAGLKHALAGLWWDAKGDWTRAQQREGQ